MSADKQTNLDLFLSPFLIIMILVTSGCNLLILIAVYRMRAHSYYFCLITMCCFGVGGGSVLLPSMFAATVDKSLLASNLHFCQFFGGLSAFLHKMMVSGFCLVYIDRFFLITKPMTYLNSHRFLFCLGGTIFSLTIAVCCAISPFAVTEPVQWSYSSPPHVPVCIFVPTNQAGAILQIVDTAVSYLPALLFMAATTTGMLSIACFSEGKSLSSSTRKLSQGLNTIASTREAWGKRGVQKNKRKTPSFLTTKKFSSIFSIFTDAQKVNTTKVSKIELVEKMENHHSTANTTATDCVKTIENGMIICEEVLMDDDGTTVWRSSATATCTSSLSFSLKHKVTLQNKPWKDNLKASKSKSEVPSQGLLSKTSNKIRLSSRLKVKKRLPVVKQRCNIKAFLTLSATFCLFSFLVLPAVILQFGLATSSINGQSFNNSVLETLLCISFSLIFWLLPLVTAIGDKEVKNTIVSLLKFCCDDPDDLVYPLDMKT